MDEQTRFQQEDIEQAHRGRAQSELGIMTEPLYGLAPHAGGHGEQPVEESAEDEAATEGGRVSDYDGLNMTWGIILGGVMTLFVIVVVLYWGVGATYSAAIVTNYPIK